MHLDEKVVHIGARHCYDLNAIDSKTNYVLAHLFVEKRTLLACTRFYEQIKRTCYTQILDRYNQERTKPKKKRKLITFVSDKFCLYKTAWKKVFSRVTVLHFGVPIACKKYGLEHNNNQIERYNGDIKDRLKTMRGGFGSIEGAEEFLNLKHIIHNFVNPNQKLNGRTPAEAANIQLELGRQKLLTLINHQGKKIHHSLR
ncbi:MAG: DDE-type integrase/transposase/recombinase [Nanoarchaeota archaeon]